MLATSFLWLPESKAGYGNGRAQEAELSNTVTVGGIKGQVGVLTSLQSSGGDSSQSTSGVVGVLWTKQEPGCTSGGPGTGGADAFHMYDWTHFGTTSVTFSATATASVSGSANRLNTGGWWWDSTNHVFDDEATVGAYVPGTGYVDVDVDWSVYSACNTYGGDFGDQTATPPTTNNDNSTNPPSSVSALYGVPHAPATNGVMNGTAQLPDEPDSEVTVQASWGAEGKGDVDNAVVNSDKLAMDVGLSSSVS